MERNDFASSAPILKNGEIEQEVIDNRGKQQKFLHHLLLIFLFCLSI
jgi:hypothetical protein